VVPSVDPDGGPLCCWVTVETATDSSLGSQLDLLSTWTWACYCWVSFSVSLVGLVFGVLPVRCRASYLVTFWELKLPKHSRECFGNYSGITNEYEGIVVAAVFVKLGTYCLEPCTTST
jgi:ABC-type uncharacterized transport system permease subunit